LWPTGETELRRLQPLLDSEVREAIDSVPRPRLKCSQALNTVEPTLTFQESTGPEGLSSQSPKNRLRFCRRLHTRSQPPAALRREAYALSGRETKGINVALGISAGDVCLMTDNRPARFRRTNHLSLLWTLAGGRTTCGIQALNVFFRRARWGASGQRMSNSFHRVVLVCLQQQFPIPRMNESLLTRKKASSHPCACGTERRARPSEMPPAATTGVGVTAPTTVGINSSVATKAWGLSHSLLKKTKGAAKSAN
jgi:hypothetical protein